MKLEDFILQQIQYLANPLSELPKSVAAFGVTPKRFESLFSRSNAIFQKIKTVLEKNRQRELDKLREEYLKPKYPFQTERDEIADKYQELINKYKDRPELLTEIHEWQIQALSPYYVDSSNLDNYINHIRTPLNERVTRFELIDFNLREIRNARKRMAEIRDDYDIEDERDEYRIPPEVKEEYNYVCSYNWKLLTAPYVFVHKLDGFDNENLSLEFVLDNFPNTKNGLNLFKWGVVCFEPSHKYWASRVTEELKETIYTQFRIFDDRVNITPIENRLKEELDIRKIKYEFQYPYKGYVLDFLIEANGKRLNVECDGKEYHSSPKAVEHDRVRNNVMASNNIFVLRFSGSEIWNDVKSCVDLIEDALKTQ